MALSSFIGSPLFWVIVYIIITWYVLKIVSVEILGAPIGEFIMANRRPEFHDIDATARLRKYREQIKAAALSKPRRLKYLYIRSMDAHHYSSEWAGMKYLGKVKGAAFYKSAHIIVFRRPWRIHKEVMVAPPVTCLSGTAGRNIAYEGTSVEVVNYDWCFPVPSEKSPITEETMRKWANLTYKIDMKQRSDISLVDFGETLLIKAGSDDAETRMRQQGIVDAMYRTETGDFESTGEVMD